MKKLILKVKQISEQPCPNCFNFTLNTNDTDIICDGCGQEFIKIDNALRFK